MEEFAEVTVLEPLDEEAKPSHIPAGDCSEVRDLSLSHRTRAQSSSVGVSAL